MKTEKIKEELIKEVQENIKRFAWNTNKAVEFVYDRMLHHQEEAIKETKKQTIEEVKKMIKELEKISMGDNDFLRGAKITKNSHISFEPDDWINFKIKLSKLDEVKE